MENLFTGRLKVLAALLILTLALYAATRPDADTAAVAARPAGLRDAPAQLSLRPEERAPEPEPAPPRKPVDPQPLRSPSPEVAADPFDADPDLGLTEEDLLPGGLSAEEILALRESGLDVDEVGYALSVSGGLAGQAPMRSLGHRIQTRRACHAPC